jgi:hypothetical protein
MIRPKGERVMKRARRRKCLCCGELFRPDARNLRHQRHCAKPACRTASKAASQRRWLAKVTNRDYFRGPINVARVQAWRAAHPGYWRRAGVGTSCSSEDRSSTRRSSTRIDFGAGGGELDAQLEPSTDKASIALHVQTHRPLCLDLEHDVAAWIHSGQPNAMIRRHRRAPPT